MHFKTIVFVLLMSLISKAQVTNSSRSQSIEFSDFEIVLNSIKNSTELNSYLSNFNGIILLKTINGLDVNEIPKELRSDKIRFYSAKEILDFDIKDYISLNCLILYSTFEVKATFTNTITNKSNTFITKFNGQ